MPAERSILDTQSERRLAQAVRSVEARSAAELVVMVRSRSGHYGGIDAVVGAFTGWLCLLYTLFAPQVFGLVWIAVMVPIAFGVGWALSRVSPGVRRTLARGRMEGWVRAAAREAFVTANVGATRRRSGILVFVSALERRVEVVPHVGVRALVPSDVWHALADSIERSIRGVALGPESIDRLAPAIEGAADALERWLPRTDADIDELVDVVATR